MAYRIGGTVDVTLEKGAVREGDEEVPKWFATADGFDKFAGDTPQEALSFFGEQIE